MQYLLLRRVSIFLRNYFSWRSKLNNTSYQGLEANDQVAVSCSYRHKCSSHDEPSLQLGQMQRSYLQKNFEQTLAGVDLITLTFLLKNRSTSK